MEEDEKRDEKRDEEGQEGRPRVQHAHPSSAGSSSSSLVVDMFEEVWRVEERLVEEGLQNGRLHAHHAAFQDGHQLGLTRGALIGDELGFYLGRLLVWAHLPSPSSSSPSSSSSTPATACPCPHLCPCAGRTDHHHGHHARHAQEGKKEEEEEEGGRRGRAGEAMGRLWELIARFPVDPSSPDLFEHLDRLRGKYRQTASLLKAPASSRSYASGASSYPPPARPHRDGDGDGGAHDLPLSSSANLRF